MEAVFINFLCHKIVIWLKLGGKILKIKQNIVEDIYHDLYENTTLKVKNFRKKIGEIISGYVSSIPYGQP